MENAYQHSQMYCWIRARIGFEELHGGVVSSLHNNQISQEVMDVFKLKETLSSAQVGIDRSGNERAVRIILTKISGYIRRGLQQRQSLH